MKAPAFVLNLQTIRTNLRKQAAGDRAVTEADQHARSYYLDEDGPLLWVSRLGVDHRADSLLLWLHRVDQMGFTERSFGVGAIEADIRRLRNLDFDNRGNDINQVVARLEYHLTRACLRYTYGQRYGFVRPHKVFNNLDVEKKDSVRNITRYRGLYDVDIDQSWRGYAHAVLRRVATDSIAFYLRQVQPTDSYYEQLKALLPKATNEEQRRRIICNMERARWRRHQPINGQEKRIVVNIPAYHLYAYSSDSAFDMRVVCGNVKTKTPQLSSYVEWMEVNPQWVIPMSIIENEVSHRAGDSAYFTRNHYNIYDKATNKQMPIAGVSRQMLLSGKYRVAQEGGAGNSLGRIVFRFKNNFSVFLHDTSNPHAFSRDSRAISHGCVRVARPFDLARFVLDEPDEWLLDRIRISMDIRPETDQGKKYLRTHADEETHKLVSYVPVKPRVPLYIIYNTLWPDLTGELQTWPDVYGYDQVIWQNLQSYML